MLGTLLVTRSLAAPVDTACVDGGEACGEVIVAAARVEQARDAATAAVRVLDRAAIEASGAATVGELLHTVPGLQVTTTHGGTGVRQQGMDPEHTLVVVDGRPLAGRVDGTLDLSRLSVTDIERVEILAGAASALYGSDALGGVISIVTRRRADAARVEGAARIGSRRTAEADVAASAAVGVVSGGIAADVRGAESYDLDAADVATTGDARDDAGARAWMRVDPAGAWSIDADGAYRRREARGVDATATGAVFDRHVLEESAEAGVATERWPGGSHVTRAALSGTFWRQQYLSDQRGSDVQDTWAETLDRRVLLAVSHRFVAGRHLFVAGLDGTAEALDSERVEGGHAARGRLALYAQEDWRVTDAPRVSLSPGARLDLDGQFGLHATPHLAVRVDPVPTLSVRLSGGQGWRAPDFRELYLWLDHAGYGYVVEGNPALGPETSWGGTGEVRWDPGALALTGGGWWNEVSGLVDVTLLEAGTASSPARYTYGNVARAVTRGANVGVELTVADRVDLQIGYDYTDARDRADDRLLDGRAPHRVVGSAAATLPAGLSLSVRGEWTGPRPFTDEAGVTAWTAPHLLLDGRAALRLGGDMTLEAGVRNALDARDEETLGLSPRTFYVGLRAGGALSPRVTPSQ